MVTSFIMVRSCLMVTFRLMVGSVSSRHSRLPGMPTFRRDAPYVHDVPPRRVKISTAAASVTV